MKVIGSSLRWSFGLALVAWAAPASAWVETHVVADDVRIEVDRSGTASIDHAITMQIKGGPMRSFDLALADVEVTPLDGTVISAQTEGLLGLPVPLGITQRPDGALRVNIESTKGLSHGAFLFHVRYKKSLLTHEDIRRDGAMLRVGWTGSPWQEGLDNAKCTFVLPAAPTEPRPPGAAPVGDLGNEGSDDEAGVFISDVRRYADRDEVELIRAHVARSEAVHWSVRMDPRALGDINDPRLRPPPPPSARPAMPVEQRALYGAGLGALLIGFSLLAFCKARQVRRHTRDLAEPRALVPIHTALRVLLAGPALALGALLQVELDDPWWGTLLVLVSMGLVGYAQPRQRRRPRGPGRWLPLQDAEAFAKVPAPVGAWLDAGTRTGLVLFALALGAVAALAFLASRVSPYDAYLVAFDGAVLFPLFGTGSVRDLPGHPVFGPGPILGRVAKKLRRLPGVRAIGWARLPEGSDQFDELRLLCAPKVPRRGFSGIEVGLVVATGAGGRLYLPEILVRVVDASPCHEAFVRFLPGLAWIRGRRADERVASLVPRLPTISMTIALLAKLVERARETDPPRTKLPRSEHEVQRAHAARKHAGTTRGATSTKTSSPTPGAAPRAETPI